jgi:hypothetical protein
VAAWAVGVEIPEPALGSTCMVRNQARAIVQMWLAGQASPKAANLATHLDPFADSSTGTSYVKDTIHEGPLAGRYAAQLLAQPRGQIGRWSARTGRSWSISGPTTPEPSSSWVSVVSRQPQPS